MPAVDDAGGSMRAFLNLAVGFKLGASGLLAVLMLGGLVGTVVVTGSSAGAVLQAFGALAGDADTLRSRADNFLRAVWAA
jgi:hypothetical protein